MWICEQWPHQSHHLWKRPKYRRNQHRHLWHAEHGKVVSSVFLFKLKQTLANFPRFPTVFLSPYFSLWICYETQIQRSKWAKQVGWVWQLTVQTFYLSSFDSKVKVKLFGAMLACLQSIHWCQGKTTQNHIISGVMKLSHILSRPVKRKDRLAFVLAATLGGQ